MTHDEIETLATKFFAAIQAGDIETVAATYSDDAVIWHNYDQIEQHKADNLRTLQYVIATVQGRSYDDVRRTVLDDGFVQQHVLRATITSNGAPYAMPACIICTLVDGRITRLDEYMDSAHVAPLIAAAEALRVARKA